MKKAFSFFFVCFLVSCGNNIAKNENSNQTQSVKINKLSLQMERTTCYGTCPAYVLTIESDGRVLFEGKNYTKNIGKAESFLSKEKLSQLVVEIENVNFFSFKDSYTEESGNCPSSATDSPTVTISAKINGNEKTIKHYLGCLEKYEPIKNNSSNVRVEKSWSELIFPQELYKFENKIDEIVGTKQWIDGK